MPHNVVAAAGAVAAVGAAAVDAAVAVGAAAAAGFAGLVVVVIENARGSGRTSFVAVAVVGGVSTEAADVEESALAAEIGVTAAVAVAVTMRECYPSASPATAAASPSTRPGACETLAKQSGLGAELQSERLAGLVEEEDSRD